MSGRAALAAAVEGRPVRRAGATRLSGHSASGRARTAASAGAVTSGREWFGNTAATYREVITSSRANLPVRPVLRSGPTSVNSNVVRRNGCPVGADGSRGICTAPGTTPASTTFRPTKPSVRRMWPHLHRPSASREDCRGLRHGRCATRTRSCRPRTSRPTPSTGSRSSHPARSSTSRSICSRSGSSSTPVNSSASSSAAGRSWARCCPESASTPRPTAGSTSSTQGATTEPARFLGEEGEFGRVVTGMPADLVLLDEDPLEDHTALREIAGVMREGSWWSRAELDAILERIAARPGAH